MRIEASILSVGTKCNGLGQLNDCDNTRMLFPKVNKTSVPISTV